MDGTKYEADGNFNTIESSKNCLTAIAEAIKDRYLDYTKNWIGSKGEII